MLLTMKASCNTTAFMVVKQEPSSVVCCPWHHGIEMARKTKSGINGPIKSLNSIEEDGGGDRRDNILLCFGDNFS